MLPLAGGWTLDSFSRHLAGARPLRRRRPDDAHLPRLPPLGVRVGRGRPRAAPGGALARRARSAARREPITFVVSLRLGEPPSIEPVDAAPRRLPVPALQARLLPGWDDAFVAALAATGAVASIDFKGAYKGTPVDVATDPASTGAAPRPSPTPGSRIPTSPCPRRPPRSSPYRTGSRGTRRSTASPTSRRSPFLPRTINVKPSRIGTWRELLRTYEWCEERDIITYGGGQSELGVGRGQIQYLASLFHADAANDIAPARLRLGRTSRRPACRRAPRPRARADRFRRRRRLASHGQAASDQVEQKCALAAMQQLEYRSDEELEAETRFRAAAQAILGARAAERMDAKRAREHFRAAIAAARPQERLQLRRMAEASLALAERRAGDLKAAAEKLGQTPPTNRQLLALRVMGVVAPPASAGIPRRILGILLVVARRSSLALLLGLGIVKLIALPFGGIGTAVSFFWGFLLVCIVLGVLIFLGRRRQKTARAKARGSARRAVQAALTRSSADAIRPRAPDPDMVGSWSPVSCTRPGWSSSCSSRRPPASSPPGVDRNGHAWASGYPRPPACSAPSSPPPRRRSGRPLGRLRHLSGRPPRRRRRDRRRRFPRPARRHRRGPRRVRHHRERPPARATPPRRSWPCWPGRASRTGSPACWRTRRAPTLVASGCSSAWGCTPSARTASSCTT